VQSWDVGAVGGATGVVDVGAAREAVEVYEASDGGAA
jgi:hypothetical protein